MRRFKEYFTESQNYSAEIESKILKLDASKFKANIDKTLYVMNMPNFKLYQDQQDVHGSYTRGSLYDALWNYRPSKTVIAHIETRVKPPVIENMNETLVFEVDGTSYKMEYKVPMASLYDRYLKTKEFNDVPEFKQIISRSTFTVDGKAFSYNTFKTRTGVEAPLTLKSQIEKQIKDTGSKIIIQIKDHDMLVRNTAILMVNEIVNDYLDSNIKTDVDTMKTKLQSAKTAEEFQHLLRDFGFEGIPDDLKVVDGIMNSKNYAYSISKPDGYGHTTGVTYTLNLFKKKVAFEGWSSDD